MEIIDESRDRQQVAIARCSKLLCNFSLFFLSFNLLLVVVVLVIEGSE